MTKAETFIALHAAAIRKRPDDYKQHVRDDPEGAARRLIDGMTDAEISRMIAEERAEARLLAKHGH